MRHSLERVFCAADPAGFDRSQDRRLIQARCLRSRFESVGHVLLSMDVRCGCCCVNLKNDVQPAVHPEFQMFLILSFRPFMNFLQRDWRSPVIFLEQIEHGPRLLFEKLFFRVANNFVVANFIRHGVAPPFEVALNSRAISKSPRSANFALRL
jgi:hypothetical protein